MGLALSDGKIVANEWSIHKTGTYNNPQIHMSLNGKRCFNLCGVLTIRVSAAEEGSYPELSLCCLYLLVCTQSIACKDIVDCISFWTINPAVNIIALFLDMIKEIYLNSIALLMWIDLNSNQLSKYINKGLLVHQRLFVVHLSIGKVGLWCINNSISPIWR